MKYSEILFGVLRIPIDIIAALGGLLVAYRLREAGIDLLPSIQLLTVSANLPSFPDYIWRFAGPTAGLYVLILAVSGLYTLKITLGPWREIARIIWASVVWLAIIMGWFFLIQRQLFFSRVLLLQATLLVTLLTVFGRMAMLLVQRSCLKRGIGVRRVASFGSHQLTPQVLDVLQADPRFRYVTHLTDLADLTKEQTRAPIDLVLHTDPHPTSDDTNTLINYCRAQHVGYAFLPPLFLDVPHQLVIGRLGLTPILQFQPTPLDGWGRVFKRIADAVGGALLLIVLSPLLLLIAILILLMMGWPLFYVSRRVGQFGRCEIPTIKFRTMVVDADARKHEIATMSHRGDGPLFKVHNDPRITPLGHVLRRWSLDELPQLLNVIVGQMALVGPRPHLPEEVMRYAESQRRVFAVRPGITGLAQVSGRSNLKFEDEVRLDMQYIEEWSPLLDLWILWRTIFVVIGGRGAD